MLHLAFGFLEWFEREDSSQPMLAPLVLLPVELNRGEPDPRTHTFRYTLRSAGEDIASNLSLQERLLADFAIALPGWEEDDSPEEYFVRLKGIIDVHPRWRIRRQVALALVSFGKLLMFLDLDPSRWPFGGPLAHPRIREFFEGIERPEGESFAPDYQLDDNPDLAGRLPPVVDDADSSQHSALVDALDGRNLVIQGPPGTGKSQTIANLIAASLFRGKSVLFVAEKLAALEVVRHRLDRVGLGRFCLELHSHKTHKRQFLDDIQKRLHLRVGQPDTGTYQARLAKLGQQRRELTDYALALNEKLGGTGLAAFDVIWRAERQRRVLGERVGCLESVTMEGIELLDEMELHAARQCAHEYALQVRQVRPIREHPWYGVESPTLTVLDTHRVTDQVRSVVSWLDQLQESMAALGAHTGYQEEPHLGRLHALLGGLGSLPEVPGRALTDVFPAVVDASVAARLHQFAGTLDRYRALERELHVALGASPRLTSTSLTTLEGHLAAVHVALPEATTLADVDRAIGDCRDVSTRLTEAGSVIDLLGRGLGTSQAATLKSLPLFERVLEAVAKAPLDVLHLRHSEVTTDRAAPALRKAASDAAAIRERGACLAQHLDLSLAPSTEDARRHLIACANAGAFRLFEKPYRMARRAYRTMARDGRVPNREAMRRTLSKLLDYRERISRLDADQEVRSISGESFDGYRTPFEGLARLADWYAATKAGIAVKQPAEAVQLSGSIWQTGEAVLRALRESDRDGTLRSTLADAVAGFRGVRNLPVVLGVDPGTTPLESVAEDLVGCAQRLEAALDSLHDHGLAELGNLAEVAAVVGQLRALHDLGRELASDADTQEVLGRHFSGETTDPEALGATLQWSSAVGQAAIPLQLKHWLLAPQAAARRAWLLEHMGRMAAVVASLEAAMEEYGQVTGADLAGALGASHDVDCREVALRAQRAIDARARFPEWLDYRRARVAMQGWRFEAMVRLVEDGVLPGDEIVAAVDFVLANALARIAFARYPVLRDFTTLHHEQVRAQFARLDREVMELFRAHAAYEIARRPVPRGNSLGSVKTFTELALLERETEKQKRNIPIRQLVQRAGAALQALKPCFMMGPLSVAQYLPPGRLKFDLVVMDEASQLKPEDALGAIARGGQLVVVGDPQQLPPTSFFERIGEDEEGDDPDDQGDLATALTEAESILDVASGLYRPIRMLRWHYRSRHGSLIAFSNKQFYRGELIAYPSPDPASPAHGVQFVPIAGGVYDARRNTSEAKAVIAAVLNHMATHVDETLGVVSMNRTQLELLELEFEQALASDPVAQRYMELHDNGLEPFFIKNLENVQGDERDVIFISVTYGPDPTGQVLQRFGPINTATGHRRLNVLVTRARTRVVVFSSMTADQIQLHPHSSLGVQALKAYLNFAQTGRLEQVLLTGREPDSEFEIEVADELRKHGHNVVAQVGVAGYYIDLAVRNPLRPGSFVLGVECDGAT